MSKLIFKDKYKMLKEFETFLYHKKLNREIILYLVDNMMMQSYEFGVNSHGGISISKDVSRNNELLRNQIKLYKSMLNGKEKTTRDLRSIIKKQDKFIKQMQELKVY